jgi:FlaA1/EpsC-like NDP-sugar epimerase
VFKQKNYFNFIIIIALSFATIWWTFFIFHRTFDINIFLVIVMFRLLFSRLILRDYSLAWSKASPKSFLIKSLVNIIAFFGTIAVFYNNIFIYFLLSELFLYLFCINFLMYFYAFLINKKYIKKTKSVVIYGAGKAGMKLEEEFRNSEYKIKYFIDDEEQLQHRSIDSIKIVSKEMFEAKEQEEKYDLLLIAMPSASKEQVSYIYDSLKSVFEEIQILPSLSTMLSSEPFYKQLKDIAIEDLLARKPQDLDMISIANFIVGKRVMITGAGGSIGSELSRQVELFGAKEIILVDNSEFNLYAINEELESSKIVTVMQNVKEREMLEKTFELYSPEIVIHAAAYKHVPLCEANIQEAINNNVLGSKNIIDLSIKHAVSKVVMVSTDKAVRPTNVMGTTKRVCELYAHAVPSAETEIVAVRFGNVLGSSGSVIPKFKAQIEKGEDITVTHPDITRYFMMIPEACQLVLQAASIAKGGELFILDMGEPIKIVDLAKKMIELSGRDDLNIVFSGLRPGEKLYEELLIDDADLKTEYSSIMVSQNPPVDYATLLSKIERLTGDDEHLLRVLKEIVPEFDHKP